ncbi:hypothetical protein GWL_36780 [Herbaspirillum sp. GW103]|nr:hypothetical protein GWL_36780 [Herbaspirillum sp. GW103]
MTSFYKNSLEDPYFWSDGETLRVLIWRGRRLVTWRAEFWLKASIHWRSVVFFKRFPARQCRTGKFWLAPCHSLTAWQGRT